MTESTSLEPNPGSAWYSRNLDELTNEETNAFCKIPGIPSEEERNGRYWSLSSVPGLTVTSYISEMGTKKTRAVLSNGTGRHYQVTKRSKIEMCKGRDVLGTLRSKIGDKQSFPAGSQEQGASRDSATTGISVKAGAPFFGSTAETQRATACDSPVEDDWEIISRYNANWREIAEGLTSALTGNSEPTAKSGDDVIGTKGDLQAELPEGS